MDNKEAGEHQSEMIRAAVEARMLLGALLSQCSHITPEELRLEEIEEMRDTDVPENYWRIQFSFMERNTEEKMCLFNNPNRIYKNVMVRKGTLEVIAIQSVEKC